MGFSLNLFQLVLNAQNSNGPRAFLVRNEFFETNVRITLHTLRLTRKLEDTGNICPSARRYITNLAQQWICRKSYALISCCFRYKRKCYFIFQVGGWMKVGTEEKKTQEEKLVPLLHYHWLCGNLRMNGVVCFLLKRFMATLPLT